MRSGENPAANESTSLVVRVVFQKPSSAMVPLNGDPCGAELYQAMPIAKLSMVFGILEVVLLADVPDPPRYIILLVAEAHTTAR
jgi:hypothetical protein